MYYMDDDASQWPPQVKYPWVPGADEPAPLKKPIREGLHNRILKTTHSLRCGTVAEASQAFNYSLEIM